MTNFTNEQLEAWAGLADKTLLEQFEGLPNWTVVPQLAAALLAERKAREVDQRLLEFIFRWLSPDRGTSDLETLSVLRNHPSIRQALKGQRDE